ncbi:MAG: hypothetical protein F6J87_10695, partial [Spirulina sp. SIO3F2]|nr:hypothetical protein [Spirulina sp. SIO3F2]
VVGGAGATDGEFKEVEVKGGLEGVEDVNAVRDRPHADGGDTESEH